MHVQAGDHASARSLMAFARQPPGTAATRPGALRVWLGGGDGWSLPVPLHSDAPAQVHCFAVHLSAPCCHVLCI